MSVLRLINWLLMKQISKINSEPDLGANILQLTKALVLLHIFTCLCHTFISNVHETVSTLEYLNVYENGVAAQNLQTMHMTFVKSCKFVRRVNFVLELC